MVSVGAAMFSCDGQRVDSAGIDIDDLCREKPRHQSVVQRAGVGAVDAPGFRVTDQPLRQALL